MKLDWEKLDRDFSDHWARMAAGYASDADFVFKLAERMVLLGAISYAQAITHKGYPDILLGAKVLLRLSLSYWLTYKVVEYSRAFISWIIHSAYKSRIIEEQRTVFALKTLILFSLLLFIYHFIGTIIDDSVDKLVKATR